MALKSIYYETICDYVLSYDCPTIEKRDGSKCYYKDKIYEQQESIDETVLAESCTGSCKCPKANGQKVNTFICAHKDCAENFGPALLPGCIRQYANDKCCSIGTVCGEKTNYKKNYVPMNLKLHL